MTVVPSPTRDMILNSSISRRMPGEAQAQAVGGRIAASIASEDVADPGALVEGDDLDTSPRPILDQPENDLALRRIPEDVPRELRGRGGDRGRVGGGEAGVLPRSADPGGRPSRCPGRS